MPTSLPIDVLLPQLVASLQQRPNLVLRAATGAGKTTRVPPALLDGGIADERMVVVVEPRRVAARAAARRIASERGSHLGAEVGYRVRFDSRASAATRLLVVTEGLIVRMLQQDPFLEAVGGIVFDEFHERHLASDLGLAMARQVQREARPDLRLIVMSATLDAEPIVRFLGGEATCGHFERDGRLFPVEIEHLKRPDSRGLPTLVRTATLRALDEEPEGDVLVFLPGVGEIRRCADFLEAAAAERKVDVAQLFGDLPPERQDAALRAGPRRRVVLATNVAETSVTVDGVRTVVDSGLVRRLRFEPGLGLDRLELGSISLASATQRAGRAGRLAPGRCLRLWTEHDHRSLPTDETPEIRRVDLAGPALELLAWGEANPAAFPWFDAPPEAALAAARDLLQDLGATHGGSLTDLGRALARIPAHPRLARLLLAGHRLGVTRAAARAAALLAERDVVFRPVGRRPVVAAYTADSDVGDRVAALDAFARGAFAETALGPVTPGRARAVLELARRFEALAERAEQVPEAAGAAGDAGELDEPDPATAEPETRLQRALLAAYPDRVCRRREPGSRRGVLVGGRGVRLAEMSAVQDAPLFLALELDAGGREALVRQASAIEADWLEQRVEEDVVFDPERCRAIGRRRTLYRDLVLGEVEIDAGPARAAEVLAAAASERLAEAVPIDAPELAALRHRLERLGAWMPELGLPRLDDALLRTLLPALAAGRRSFDELRRAPWLDVVRGHLPPAALRDLDRCAPDRLEVPSGSRLRLDYAPAEAPVLAVKIQEMFGLDSTPTVADGRVPVLLHLLAPNGRPQQVTRDLPSFWRNAYPQVRAELAGRYPKHPWPTDPLSAEPTRRTKRRRAGGDRD
ncbi:MAG: ATP-dependent helicase HrpB [Acidobacteriota bacterium]